MGASSRPVRAPGPARPRPTTPAGALAQAHRIAEAVDQAWHTTATSDRTEIPLSVVAALALRTPDDADERAWVVAQLTGTDDNGLLGFLRATWQMFARVRPDLFPRVALLAAPWFTDPAPDPDLLRAVRRVVDAALRAGLHELLGAARYDVDLFGPLLMVLRTRGARAARGQYYTPPDLADLLARLGGTLPQAGELVWEPTAGTGGLLRAAAQAIRDAGGDPRTIRWVAVDRDELALAALATNVIIWDLGPQVLIGHGDVLADDWQARALGERAEALALARDVHQAARALTLLRHLDRTDSDLP
ncbi:SAM-dependent DNA methyltransferase [Frankia sp. B2]|uniref:N-6 DNA methylase n=1 Tax=unclassified Frankia TaxID=2632575 RepID=UPI0006CA47DE|nr:MULTISPECIES: N-6 DNA methylase [unclassified Frankia]TFE26500.1 SAM-dependent DNA methyltransferase [Frankia sp. B2]